MIIYSGILYIAIATPYIVIRSNDRDFYNIINLKITIVSKLC